MSIFGSPNIQKMEEKRDVKGLIKALYYQKDHKICPAAAEALGRIGDPAAVDDLIAVQRIGFSTSLRRASVEALAKIGDPRAVLPLLATSKGTDRGVYNAAQNAFKDLCKALGKTSDPNAVKPLIDALKDKNPDMRLHTAIKDAIIQIGPHAVEALIAELNNGAGNREAALLLGEIGDQRALKPLVAASMVKNKDMRWAAATALGQIGDKKAVKPLIKVLKDEDDLVRSWAKNSFGRNARQAAVEALGKIGDPSTVEVLIEALEDEDETVQRAAKQALELFSDSQASEALALAKEGRKTFREEGGYAVYTFKKTCLGNPLDLEVKTEKYCVYCMHLREPNLRDPNYPKGVGDCSNFGRSGSGVVSFDETCSFWEPNNKVRFWLSKGYMQHNHEGWPKQPWYQVFDDGPDGEKGTR